MRTVIAMMMILAWTTLASAEYVVTERYYGSDGYSGNSNEHDEEQSDFSAEASCLTGTSGGSNGSWAEGTKEILIEWVGHDEAPGGTFAYTGYATGNTSVDGGGYAVCAAAAEISFSDSEGNFSFSASSGGYCYPSGSHDAYNGGGVSGMSYVITPTFEALSGTNWFDCSQDNLVVISTRTHYVYLDEGTLEYVVSFDIEAECYVSQGQSAGTSTNAECEIDAGVVWTFTEND
jgi:hypothetical protein